MDLQRTVLVTGASRGIGRAISLRLLEAGCRVIGIGRDFSDFAADLKGFEKVELDLARLDELPDRLQALSRAHPAIDTVICNAGSGRFGSLEEFSARQIRHRSAISGRWSRPRSRCSRRGCGSDSVSRRR